MSAPQLHLRPAPAATKRDMLSWEKELLGLFLSGNPIDEYRERLAALATPIEKAKRYPEGAMIVTGGVIASVREITTAKGERMAFVKLVDASSAIEAVVFPRTYIECKEMLQEDRGVKIKGRISKRRGEDSIIIEKIKEL